MQEIVIKFKCKCAAHEIKTWVRHRMLGESLENYMKNIVQPAVSNSHLVLQIPPNWCDATETEYIKMPFEENNENGLFTKPENKH